MKPRTLFLICLIPLLGWWLYGLFDLDEGFYGAVVSEMNRRGEWISPFFNNELWYEKPILLYWFAKPCVILFGPTLGARLPSVLAAAGCYWLVFWFARQHLDKLALRPVRSGYLAMLILATSLLFVYIGRAMMTDMLLTFCLTAMFFGYWHGLTEDPKAFLWSGAALGGAILAKGPVGIILLIPIALYAAFFLKKKPSLWAVGGALVAIAVAASWYVPAYLKDGDVFVQKFLVEQNLNRFRGGDLAHSIGVSHWVYFIPIMFLAMAPWSFFDTRSLDPNKKSQNWILAALKFIFYPLRLAWPSSAKDPALRYLGACVWVPFAFFSASSAQLVHYILPCLPPLALLLGVRLSESWNEIPKWSWRWLAAVTILINGGVYAWYQLSGHAEVHALARSVKDRSEPVVVYQMSRREKELGTGKPKIRETSHPSIEFVLDHPYLEAETLEDLKAAPKPLLIITRANRISDADRASLESSGLKLKELKPVPVDNYRLYELSSQR